MMSSESNNEDSSSEEFELEDSQLNSSGSGIKVNQRIIRKANRNNGDSYVNTSGNFVRSKSFQAVSKCCPKKCYEKVENQVELFNAFYDCGEKVEQDVYLAGCMTAQPVKRVGVNVKKNRELSWIYSVKFMGQMFVTCQTFLLNLYQITRKRLRIIQKKALEGDTFKDMRGCHSNRPNKVESSVWDLAKKHLESLPHKTSHYSRQKSSKLYFENPNLNVKILFQLFQSFYKESTGLSLKIGYRCYFNFF